MTTKVDVFAAGIMLADIIVHYLRVPGTPYSTEEFTIATRGRLLSEALGRVQGQFPQLARLLVACTDPDHSKRCSAAEALEILGGGRSQPAMAGVSSAAGRDSLGLLLLHGPVVCRA